MIGERLVEAGAGFGEGAGLLAGVAAFVEDSLELRRAAARRAGAAGPPRLERGEAELGCERPHVGGEAGGEQGLGLVGAELGFGLVEQAVEHVEHVAVGGDEEVGEGHFLWRRGPSTILRMVPLPIASRQGGFGWLRLMLRDQPVELGDALALGRALGEALEAAGRPQGLAFGFERLGVEVGHQSCSRPSAPM